MTKHFLFILLFCTSSLLCWGQSEETLQKVADASCECMSKTDYASMDRLQAQTALGQCMFSAVGELPANQKNKIKLNDMASMESFGQQVGLRMYKSCPKVIKKVSMLMLEDEEEEETYNHIEASPPPPPPPSPALATSEPLLSSTPPPSMSTLSRTASISGTVSEVINGDAHVVYEITTSDSKVFFVYWEHPFQGDEILIKDPKAILNKKVNIAFQEEERINPLTRKYTKYPVIFFITFLE